MKNIKLNNKNKISFIIGSVFLLILLIGSAFAYYKVTSNNVGSLTAIGAQGDALANAIMTTEVTELRLDLTSELMHKNNIGKYYYLTPPGEDVGNSIKQYTFAKIEMTSDAGSMDCSYSFDVTATIKNPVSDGSDENLVVRLVNHHGNQKNYTLKQLLEGVEFSGNILGLTYNNPKELLVDAYFYNSSELQNDFSDNTYTISIKAKEGEDGFSCYQRSDNLLESAGNQEIASFIATNGKKITGLWESGLEGDGVRFTGETPKCSYDGYDNTLAVSSVNAGCPTLYNYVRTEHISGSTNEEYYSTNCPEDYSYEDRNGVKYEYTFECTEVNGVEDDTNVANNYICFGTDDMNECTNNKEKYLYRIIGSFPDENSDYHLKLIKFNSIGQYKWHSDSSQEILNWENSDLFFGLNGEYFLNNPNYSYMQDALWSEKIENWKWNTAINIENTGTPEAFYLNETNKPSKDSTTGQWFANQAKIGLMYASDYELCLGDVAFGSSRPTGGGPGSQRPFENGWLAYFDSNINDWTITGYETKRYNGPSSVIKTKTAYIVSTGKLVLNSYSVDSDYDVHPTFYLTSDVKLKSGKGTLTEPYIIETGGA